MGHRIESWNTFKKKNKLKKYSCYVGDGITEHVDPTMLNNGFGLVERIDLQNDSEYWDKKPWGIVADIVSKKEALEDTLFVYHVAVGGGGRTKNLHIYIQKVNPCKTS